MWILRGRDNKTKEWSNLGEFQSVADATARILALEGDLRNVLYHPDCGISFRVRFGLGNPVSDADLFSRLELRCTKYFYLVMRAVQYTGSAPDISVGAASKTSAEVERKPPPVSPRTLRRVLKGP